MTNNEVVVNYIDNGSIMTFTSRKIGIHLWKCIIDSKIVVFQTFTYKKNDIY